MIDSILQNILRSCSSRWRLSALWDSWRWFEPRLLSFQWWITLAWTPSAQRDPRPRPRNQLLMLLQAFHFTQCEEKHLHCLSKWDSTLKTQPVKCVLVFVHLIAEGFKIFKCRRENYLMKGSERPWCNCCNNGGIICGKDYPWLKLFCLIVLLLIAPVKSW